MCFCVCGYTGVHCLRLYGNRVTCLLCVCTRVVFAHVEMARGVVCGPRIACVYVTSTCNCLNLTFLSVRGSQELWPAVIFTKLSSSSTTIT